MTIRLLALSVVVFTVLFCSGVSGKEVANLELLIRKANALDLSQHAVWHKLLHYEPHFMGVSSIRSGIHDSVFFNANNGSSNPEDELNATLRALLSPKNVADVRHAQCRFPARYI